jgi:hypothetical protein
MLSNILAEHKCIYIENYVTCGMFKICGFPISTVKFSENIPGWSGKEGHYGKEGLCSAQRG